MRWLAFLLSFNQALWIDVPFIPQDKNGCGSASVWMVLEYWKKAATPPLEEIHRQLFSRDAGGIYARDMDEYFRRRGFRTFSFKAEWTDLEQHIARGRPLIVCLERNARGTPLHYVVVAGIDSTQNIVLVNDPALRKLSSMDRDEFERRWKATDNWALLAVPEVDLASQAFREERNTEAKDHLESALRSSPEDAYVNEFLASVYFLENNIEAALKYWNRADKPVIDDIRTDPPLLLDPLLLDRAFTFSRGGLLSLSDFRTTRARLEATQLFSRIEMELIPSSSSSGAAAPSDRFDVVLRAAERGGWSPIPWMRGLAYQTIHPEVFNIGGNAVNIRSLLRWDPDRQRANVVLSAPIGGDPKWRYEAGVDARRESWADGSGDFRLHRSQGTVQMVSTPSGTWSWSSGFAFAFRRFEQRIEPEARKPDSSVRTTGATAASDSCVSTSCGSLKYTGTLKRTLLNVPEHRFSVDSSVTAEAGKLFGKYSTRFGKLYADVKGKWFPLSRGDDYELTARLRSGRIAGGAPVDELFILGLDRDSELWARGTRGRFTARSFVLTNWEFLKDVRDLYFLRFRMGPFVDAARSSRWVADTGLQFQVSALGAFTANVSYGKNLQTGDNVWFVNTSR